MKNRFGFLAVIVLLIVNPISTYEASAQSWQCQIQIPKSGNVSSWCGMSPVSLRINGMRGSGWIGMQPFNLSFSTNRVSGWIGMNAVSLSKSGSYVSGWVGQNPINCRVSSRNNFCLTVIATDPE